MASWTPKTFDEVCKRAAGRRRYQAQRRRERDKRQLIVLGVLVQLKWQSYGVGRLLANSLSVDPATISRDIRYLRKWRKSFLMGETEAFADAIVWRMVLAGIHPRHGYYFTYVYEDGVSSLTVRRGFRYAKDFRRRALEASPHKGLQNVKAKS